MNSFKPTNDEFINALIEKAQEKKAYNILVVNPKEASSIADWFVVCESTSVVHTKAIAESILYGLKQDHQASAHAEGMEEGRWVVLDYGTVVVNIMLKQMRHYYQLESLWSSFHSIAVDEINVQ